VGDKGTLKGKMSSWKKKKKVCPGGGVSSRNNEVDERKAAELDTSQSSSTRKRERTNLESENEKLCKEKECAYKELHEKGRTQLMGKALDTSLVACIQKNSTLGCRKQA